MKWIGFILTWTFCFSGHAAPVSPELDYRVDYLVDEQCTQNDPVAGVSLAAAQGRIDWGWHCYPDQMEATALATTAGEFTRNFNWFLRIPPPNKMEVVYPVFGTGSTHYVRAPIDGKSDCDTLDREVKRPVNIVGLCFVFVDRK